MGYHWSTACRCVGRLVALVQVTQMFSHYQPLLPPPRYMSLMEYRHKQKQFGTRRKIAIQRALNPTLSSDDHYDRFNDAALADALNHLRKTQPVAALESLVHDCIVKGIPVPPQGVHAHKVGFKGASASSSVLTRQDGRPVVILTRRIPR